VALITFTCSRAYMAVAFGEAESYKMVQKFVPSYKALATIIVR
jgi:hypothetical protein